MSMSRLRREAVYRKYGGRCAYCGNPILMKDMQVDHFVPKYKAAAYEHYTGGDVESLDNLYPSCRLCNHYKRANGIETFRKWIEEIPRKLKREYIYNVGVKYGIVQPQPRKIQFFFEKVKDMIALDEEAMNCLKRGDRVYTEDKKMIIVDDVYCDGTYGMTVQDTEGCSYVVGEIFKLK